MALRRGSPQQVAAITAAVALLAGFGLIGLRTLALQRNWASEATALGWAGVGCFGVAWMAVIFIRRTTGN